MSEIVGLAGAMKDGGFKVVRFSLLGSTRAISIMREGAKALSQGGGTEVKLRSEEYL